jgi:hypothetical protein
MIERIGEADGEAIGADDDTLDDATLDDATWELAQRVICGGAALTPHAGRAF